MSQVESSPSILTLASDDSSVQFDVQNGLKIQNLMCDGVQWNTPLQFQWIGPHFGSFPGVDAHHGLASHTHWDATVDEGRLHAFLEGKDRWEGQNFRMEISSYWEGSTLVFNVSVVSDTDSVVGLILTQPISNQTRVTAGVQPKAYDETSLIDIDSLGNRTDQGRLDLDLPLKNAAGLLPYPNPLGSFIDLFEQDHQIHLEWLCQSQENSCYVQTKDQNLIIAPLSSQNPWRPNLTVSSIQIRLKISTSR